MRQKRIDKENGSIRTARIWKFYILFKSDNFEKWKNQNSNLEAELLAQLLAARLPVQKLKFRFSIYQVLF